MDPTDKRRLNLCRGAPHRMVYMPIVESGWVSPLWFREEQWQKNRPTGGNGDNNRPRTCCRSPVSVEVAGSSVQHGPEPRDAD